MKTWGLYRGALCAALTVPGCLVVTDDDPEPLIGTLTVEWTIDGQQDPLDCADLGVDRLELVISDDRGNVVDEIEPLCETFSASIDLYEGRYFGDATLVDRRDRSATLTEELDALDILAGTDLVVSVDFPIGSFL